MIKLLASFPEVLQCRLFLKTIFLIFTFGFSSVLFTQIPQYYNANSGGIGNSLPFGSIAVSGYECQWLIGPGEYLQPTPAPNGEITKLYIYMSTSGSGTYTNLTIKMGQTTLTSLPVGAYTGTLDTVYFRASIPLSSVMNTWLSFTLDSSFTYNPAQSLVIQVSHCGLSGNGMNIWQTAGTTGIIRRNPIGGTPSCVFTYSGQDTRVLQNGLDISPPVGISNNNEIPAPYRLEQNYPNPFNPATNINFEIPKEGYVELKVYNSLGMELAAIVNDFLNAGSYQTVFDASALASGVYYYTIRVNDFKETKKMLLIK